MFNGNIGIICIKLVGTKYKASKSHNIIQFFIFCVKKDNNEYNSLPLPLGF